MICCRTRNYGILTKNALLSIRNSSFNEVDVPRRTHQSGNCSRTYRMKRKRGETVSAGVPGQSVSLHVPGALPARRRRMAPSVWAIIPGGAGWRSISRIKRFSLNAPIPKEHRFYSSGFQCSDTFCYPPNHCYITLPGDGKRISQVSVHCAVSEWMVTKVTSYLGCCACFVRTAVKRNFTYFYIECNLTIVVLHIQS